MNNEKIRHIKYEGVLELTSELKLPCYVLDDGTRVISGRGMQNVLKMSTGDDSKSEEMRAGDNLTRFTRSKWFKELVTNDIGLAHFLPLVCYKGNQKINGYEATSLVDFCNLVLKAREDKKIKTERQAITAVQCEILVRAFAKVGIIALIDEATGYQYDREKFELQAILKLFISPDILEWQQAFHLGFYKEIFRLWGVPFTPQNIKRKPPFIGTLTNEFVYKNLPKGSFVLKRLKEKTPKTEAGNYKVRLHQSLTPFGKEELKKVIYSVESLAVISENKTKFKRLLQERYGQKEIPFPEYDEPETKKIEKPTSFDNVLKGMLSVPPPPKDDKGKS